MKLGNVYGVYRHSQAMVENAERIRVPLRVFTTAIDDAADLGDIRKIYERSGGDRRNGVHHFPAEASVPHPMLHWRENEQAESISLLTRLSQDFLAHGKRSHR